MEWSSNGTLDEIIFEHRSEPDTAVPNFVDHFISSLVAELFYDGLDVVRGGELKHGASDGLSQ